MLKLQCISIAKPVKLFNVARMVWNKHADIMTHNTLSEKDENYSSLKTYSDLQFEVPECHQLQKMSFTDVTLYCIYFKKQNKKKTCTLGLYPKLTCNGTLLEKVIQCEKFSPLSLHGGSGDFSCQALGLMLALHNSVTAKKYEPFLQDQVHLLMHCSLSKLRNSKAPLTDTVKTN